MKRAKKKLAILISHPIQYFALLFAEFRKRDEIEVIVYYCSDISVKGGEDEEFGRKIKWDIPLLEGYDHYFLRNYSWNPRLATNFWGLINWGIFTRLRKDKPDILIIHGWVYFSYLLGFLAAKFFL